MKLAHAFLSGQARVTAGKCSISNSVGIALIGSLLCAGVAGCCSGNTNCHQSGSLGPSGAEVALVAVGAGAAVATVVAVHHSHHMLKGCASAGANGLELQSDAKTYLLSGQTANIKAGDQVLVHGTKVKQAKHSTGEQTFSVEKLGKDYGPCKLKVSSSPANP